MDGADRRQGLCAACRCGGVRMGKELYEWIRKQEKKTQEMLEANREQGRILEIQLKAYRDMIAEYQQKDSPVITLASTQDYHSNN